MSIETNVARLEMDIKYIKEGQDSLKELLVKHIEQTNKRFDKQEEVFDKRYATKQTEKFVFGLAGIVLTAFVTAAVTFVIK